MENDPQQPIEQRHHHLTPDQEAHARREVERALNNLSDDEPLITAQTARIIAATIHRGEGSVLEHFAATNRLNPDQALREVRQGLEHSQRMVWSLALELYLEQIESPLPDVRPPEYKEPAPEVFLRSPKSGKGDWVALGGAPSRIESSLEAIDPGWQRSDTVHRRLDRDDWQIGNVVGFHGLDVSSVTNLRSLARLAQGLNKYGESFAAYLELFGIEGASRYTYQRLHIGSFENLTDVLGGFAFTNGMLDADNIPGEVRTREPMVNLRLLEHSLADHYRWHEGRSRLHLFSRDTLPQAESHQENNNE